MRIEEEIKNYMLAIVDEMETITELAEEAIDNFNPVNEDWVWDMAEEIFHDYCSGA
jgi:uncharacterized protein Yka (UPF0111/DUF47 family)